LKIPELHIETQTLRYLIFLQENIMQICYEDVIVKVPEPAAFTLHKYILSVKRQQNKNKSERDLGVAIEMTRFLLGYKEQRIRLEKLYQAIPKKWQKTILSVVEDNAPELHALLMN
jgi:hypothetical protein